MGMQQLQAGVEERNDAADDRGDDVLDVGLAIGRERDERICAGLYLSSEQVYLIEDVITRPVTEREYARLITHEVPPPLSLCVRFKIQLAS